MPRAKDHKGDDWMRAQDAAKRLEVTRPTVLAMVAREELDSTKFGGLVFVYRPDVEAKRAAMDAERAAIEAEELAAKPAA